MSDRVDELRVDADNLEEIGAQESARVLRREANKLATPGSTAPSELEFLGNREAFHCPAVLVRSDQELQPGEYVLFQNAITVLRVKDRTNASAIVDPFLPEPVPSGDMFWAMILPGRVTKLSHHFEAEGVPAPAEIDDAEYDDEAYDECAGCP